MRSNNKGLIINTLDQRVKNITPYFTSYTISKCALEALTKSLALYLAPKIRVNGISPGPTIKSKHQTINQFKNQVSKTPLLKKELERALILVTSLSFINIIVTI